MIIFAIDPGNTESAYAVIDSDNFRPIEVGKVKNERLRFKLTAHVLSTPVDPESHADAVIIERIASYGMPVGREVFETCEWIGRFAEIAAQSTSTRTDYVYRAEEKINLCHSAHAKDANIRRALIDRFAEHDLVNGRGTKANPDWFYFFHSDIWAAYAVGVTWIDREKNENVKASTEEEKKD